MFPPLIATLAPLKIFIKTASLITLLLIGSCGGLYYSIQPIDEQTNTRTARNYFEKLTNLSCEEVGDISIKSTQQFRDPVYYLYFKNTNIELVNKIVKLNLLSAHLKCDFFEFSNNPVLSRTDLP